MNADRIALAPGLRLTLPSGRRVEVLRLFERDGAVWDCAYLSAMDTVLPAGAGKVNRIALKDQFLRDFGRACTTG